MCSPVYGGASRHTQIDELAKGVELVVATPLRLIDLLKSNELVLDDIQIVCLDEADRMADDGFTPQVEWVLRHCTNRNQTMLFSATLDGDVGHLIRHYLSDPVEVAVDEATDTVGTMHHLFLAVHHMDKDKVIGAIGQGIPKIVVFCQTKRNCDRVARNLDDLGCQVLGDPRRPPAEGARTGAAAVRRGQARRAGRHRRGGTWHRHRRHRCGDPLRAGQGREGLPAPLGPHRSGRVATAGRSRSSSTTSTRRCASCSAGCVCPSDSAIEVFSNNPNLRDLASFGADVTT